MQLRAISATLPAASVRVTASRPSLTGKTCRPPSWPVTQRPCRRWDASCRRSPWRDPRNLRDPSNARARQLVTSAVPISVACFAGCGSASLTDGRCEALQGLARPTFRPRVKRRRSTRALVLPKKPVNLVFALETWLEGTHQH
ncbi:unnamed protein product [Effrenium voratum]|nr:unnamed protein product [Effrenium voratum]